MQPLKPIRLTDQIVEHVRAHIADEQLRPGDTLPSEVELARRLGVGRPTVREAMNAMAGMGLIHVTSGRAPVVGSLNADSLNKIVAHGLAVQQISAAETLEFRRFIEERSVRLAARLRDDEHIAAMQSALDEMKASIGDIDRFSQADIAFHKTLARASGNALVRVVVEGIAEVALASSLGGLRLIQSKSEWRTTYALHQDIAQAVIAADADGAEAAMRRHFDNASTRLARGATQASR